MLIGHQAQRDAFIEGLLAGRLHHAWLLAGPRGIGKRAFADAAARRVLAGEEGPFEVDDDHRVAHLMRAGSHMDFRVLEREEDDKGKLRASIIIDQVRALQPVLRGTPALGSWRAIIVDSIDDLNRSAANALLKSLEEPPQGTLFLLVSHAPARLLPTIRSRCRLLRFQPLADEEVAAVLRLPRKNEDPLVEDEIADLVAVAEGAPGRALEFAGLDVAGLNKAIERLVGNPAPAAANGFARAFAAAGAAPRFEALCRLVPARLAAAARRWPSAHNLRIQGEAEQLAANAVALQLDRPQAAFALARLLGQVEAPVERAACIP